MKFTTNSRRFAAVGAAAALTAGTLVGLTGSTATAAPEVANDYTCSVPGLAGPYNVTMLTNAVGIEGFPQIGAGADIPANLLSVTNRLTIPAEAYGLFTQFGVDNVTFPDMAADFGGNPVGVTGMTAEVADMTDNGDGTYSFDAPGVNAPFQVPVAGAYNILMPSGFTISANNAEGTALAGIICDLAEGETASSLHQITVVKNATTTTGEAIKKQFAHGTKAKVAAAVAGGTLLEGDKVLLKKGTTTLDSARLNPDGKATLVTNELPVGKNKVTVVYKATGYNSASKSEQIVVNVVR